jgi:hypothetical protein
MKTTIFNAYLRSLEIIQDSIDITASDEHDVVCRISKINKEELNILEDSAHIDEEEHVFTDLQKDRLYEFVHEHIDHNNEGDPFTDIDYTHFINIIYN